MMGISSTAACVGNSSAIGNGYHKFDGTDSSSAGPHFEVYTTADTSNPVYQQLNWSHNNVAISFD